VSASGERRRRLVLVLAALALVVRIGHLAAVHDGPMSAYHRLWKESDMRAFDDWAQRVAGGDVLGRTPLVVPHRWYLDAASAEEWQRWLGGPRVFFKAPGYPYLLAVVRLAVGDPWLVMVLLQIGSSVAAVPLLFELTARRYGEAAGLAAAAWLAVYGPDVHYDVVLLRGPFITFVCLLSAWQLARLRRHAVGARAACAIGLVCGLGVVLHEGLALLPVLVVPWLGWRAGPGARRALGAFALGCGVALLPVVARNVAVGAPPFQLAANAAASYAMNNAAQSDPLFFEVRPEVFVPLLREGGGTLGGTALACLRTFEGPGALLRHYLRRGVGLLVPFEISDNASPYNAALRSVVLSVLPGYGVLLPFLVLGTVHAARRPAAVLHLLPSVLALLAGVVMNLPMSRYRASLAVLLLPLAGLATARLLRALRPLRPGRLAAAAAVLAATALASRGLEQRYVFAGRDEAALRYRGEEFALGLRYEAEKGRWAQLARESEDLATLNPLPEYRLMGLLSLVRAQSARGRTAEAAAAFAAARRAGGDDPALLLATGDLFQAAGDPGMARATWAAALRQAADEATRREAHRRLGPS
jgi:hypothetical protein